MHRNSIRPKPPEPPKQLPRHIRIVSGPLASGDFGTVWKAKHDLDEGDYAIKQVFINRSLVHFGGIVEKLLRETRLLQEVNSKYVVKYHGSWLEGPHIATLLKETCRHPPGYDDLSSSESAPSDEDYLCIQLEFCDITLKDWLVNHRSSESRESEIPQIFRHLSTGLKAIHEEKIIHRDIKPDNIFGKVDSRTNTINWKIGDLGLSIRLHEDSGCPDEQENVNTISVAGCLEYRSPEMLTNKDYDETTDVFSLGLVFLEILSGFGDRDDVFKSVRQGQITYLISSLIPSKYKDESTIICAMLNLNGKERLDSIQLCEMLHTGEYPLLLREIYPSKNPVVFEIGPVTNHFVGRRTEVLILTEIFEHRHHFLVAIVGMGGVGKTELAKTFATNISSERRKVHTIWLNGDDTANLSSCVNRLAKALKVETQDSEGSQSRPMTDIFTDILESLCQTGVPTVMVIDNVDQANKEVEVLLSLVRKSSYHCLAIVTSRTVGVLKSCGYTLDLDVLDDPDAHQLVSESIDGPENIESIRELCLLLQNFPLALQQAIAFIKEQKCRSIIGREYKIGDYLVAYEKYKVKLLGYELNQIDHDYRETTLVTWNVSIDKIKSDETYGQLGIQLLNIIAYLDPSGIPVEFLIRLCSNMDKDSLSIGNDVAQLNQLADTGESIEEAILLIKAYSLVKVEKCVLTIHRLVQEVIRVKLNTSTPDPNITPEPQLLTSILNSLKIYWKQIKRQDLTHVLSIWKYASKYSDLIKEFNAFPAQVGEKLITFSVFDKLLPLCTSSCSLLTAAFNKFHKQALIMRSMYAYGIRALGDYHKSLDLLQKVLTEQQVHVGESDESTLTTQYYMALCLYSLTRYDDALTLFRLVLDVRKEILEPDDEKVMLSKHDLAKALMRQEHYAEAMDLFLEIEQWSETYLGEDHPKRLGITRSIGRCLVRQGKVEEAKQVFEQLLDTTLKIHGVEHVSTFATQFCLAGTLDTLGQHGEALKILNQVLSLREKVLGPQHPMTKLTRDKIETIASKSEKPYEQMQVDNI